MGDFKEFWDKSWQWHQAREAKSLVVLCGAGAPAGGVKYGRAAEGGASFFIAPTSASARHTEAISGA